MIHYGPNHQPCSGANGGVAIVLSPELEEAWEKLVIKVSMALLAPVM